MRWFWEMLYRRQAVEVVLDRDCIRVLGGDGPTTLARLRDVEREWCRHNVRRPFGLYCRWRGVGGGYHAYLWFIEPKDAALFKMFQT